MRQVGLFLICGIILVGTAVSAATPQHFSGNVAAYVNSDHQAVVSVDLVPADGKTDVSFTLETTASIAAQLPSAPFAATADWYSDEPARLVVNSTDGLIHLDLSVVVPTPGTYSLPPIQAPTSATTVVSATGLALRFQKSVGGTQSMTTTRSAVATVSGLGFVRVESQVVRYSSGPNGGSSTVLLELPDLGGSAITIPLIPGEVAAFKAAALDALHRAQTPGNSTQDSCYDECMAASHCDVEGALGAMAGAMLMSRLGAGETGSNVGGGVGSLVCHGANSLGCSYGCGDDGGDPPEHPCQPGAVCRTMCLSAEAPAGTCSAGGPDTGSCCIPICWNPPFEC